MVVIFVFCLFQVKMIYCIGLFRKSVEVGQQSQITAYKIENKCKERKKKREGEKSSTPSGKFENFQCALWGYQHYLANVAKKISHRS